MKHLIVSQTLHGYSSGHHLLASSNHAISDRSKKTMSILSDWAGSEVIDGFDSYITGYPLPEGLYAFAKTWYADDMKRPGCAWTHTFLIENSDLSITDFFALQKLFRRPGTDDQNGYDEKVIIPIDETFSNQAHLSYIKLESMIYAYLSTEKSIVLPASNSKEYEEELLALAQFVLPLIGSFSFCAGALSMRFLEKQPFDFQVVPNRLVRLFSRNSDIFSLNESIKIPNSGKKWSAIIAKELHAKADNQFGNFVEQYAASAIVTRGMLSNCAEIYCSSEAYARTSTLELMLKAFRLSNNNDLVPLSNIANSYYSLEICTWFKYHDMLESIIDLSTIEYEVELDNKSLSRIYASIEVRMRLDYEALRDIVIRMAQCTLNSTGEMLLRVVGSCLNLTNFASFTQLDDRLCSIFISNNPELAVASEIWQRDVTFMSDMLSVIKRTEEIALPAERIISSIVENSQFVLDWQVFYAFGDCSIGLVLSKLQNDAAITMEWIKICRFNTQACMEWLIAQAGVVKPDILYGIVCAIDPFSNMVLQFGKGPWEKMFKDIRKMHYTGDQKLTIALFLLPILIRTKGRFSVDIASFIFTSINAKLANQQLSVEDWIKIDPLLPTVAFYNSWDKCKRLRKAFKQKDYSIDDLQRR